MADYQRLITTEDIQRRYNLQGLESDRKIIQTLNNNLTKTFGIIKNYITCMTSLGSKEQYFLSGVPTLENYPYTEWEDPEEHINTVYYDTDGGKVYIFKYNSQDEYYYWEESMDSSLLNAMSVANSQADVSEDNLRRVFYEQPTVPYNVGDIWINGSKIYRCMRNETAESQFYQDDWIDYLQYNDSVATSNALRILGEFKETVETEYVTKTLLETTTDTINAEVSRVQTLAEGKSATYTEQPTPPYYKGDTYIKEVTDSETGITMNLIYVCQYTRLEGTYHEEDFSLQPGYATLSQIKVTNDAVTTTVAKVNGQDVKLSTMEQTINEINTKISDIADITVTDSTETGSITMNGINASEPIDITIIPRVDDITYLYPGANVYPGSDTYLSVRTLEFHNTFDGTYLYYEIPRDLLYYDSETYDEYRLHFGGSTPTDLPYCEVIHRVGINNNGEKYALENETVESITPYPHINLTDGDYEITLLGYSRAYMKFTLMGKNLYTTQFATRVEMNSAISQSAGEINLEVNKRIIGFDENGQRTDDIFSSINLAPGTIKINANKIDIAGTITAINNNTTTTINGNKITTGSIGATQVDSSIITTTNLSAQTINANQITTGTLNGNNVNVTNINADNIKTGILKSQNYVANASGTSINLNNGVIDTKNFKVNSSGNITATGANITGSITATSGTIGGCSITNGVLQIANANIGSINAEKITAGVLNVDRIPNLSAGKITSGTMSADRIYGGTINGNNISVVNLNAGNITAGTLNVDRIPNLNASKITTGTMSANRITGGTLQGSTIKATSGKIGCWKINSANIKSSRIRLADTVVYDDGGTTSFGAQWHSIILAGQNASDKRLKKDIKDIQLYYDKFYDDLKPKEFYYKSNTMYGNKKHLGFIAQDIEESLKKYNIEDMALIWEDEKYYNLDKRELIALNVWQIQMLKKRVNELEEQVWKNH